MTQPYDKITPAMRRNTWRRAPTIWCASFLANRAVATPLRDNVYTRAAQGLEEWIENGILEPRQGAQPVRLLQEFRVPDTGEYLMRKGFIGLGQAGGLFGGRRVPPRADFVRS